MIAAPATAAAWTAASAPRQVHQSLKAMWPANHWQCEKTPCTSQARRGPQGRVLRDRRQTWMQAVGARGMSAWHLGGAADEDAADCLAHATRKRTRRKRPLLAEARGLFNLRTALAGALREPLCSPRARSRIRSTVSQLPAKGEHSQSSAARGRAHSISSCLPRSHVLPIVLVRVPGTLNRIRAHALPRQSNKRVSGCLPT